MADTDAGGLTEGESWVKMGGMNTKADLYPMAQEGEPVVLPKFAAAGHRHYSPRVTFQVKTLTPAQRANLRTAMYIIRLLESRVRLAGSIRKAARLMGVSKSFLSEVLKGKKPPGFNLARQVGYLPKVFYLRVLEDPEDPSVLKNEGDLVLDQRGVIKDRVHNRQWEKIEAERHQVPRRNRVKQALETLDAAG